MLQQTRVAAVIPYYARFLEWFPNPSSLAAAEEPELLRAWSGLGYYSRVRNMQRAAVAMAGVFPSTYEAIRKLPGIGDYTAAAVASIAFQLPYAAVDGNVLRVLSRVSGDSGDIGAPGTRQRLSLLAQSVLNVTHPGEWNQAMMELGATVCLPRDPQCLICPIAGECVARQQHRQNELPVKLRKTQFRNVERTMLLIEQDGAFLFRQRSADSAKLKSFWELPNADDLPSACMGEFMGTFRHCITNTRYVIQVCRASVQQPPDEYVWLTDCEQNVYPISTESRKAMRLLSSKLASIRVRKAR